LDKSPTRKEFVFLRIFLSTGDMFFRKLLSHRNHTGRIKTKMTAMAIMNSGMPQLCIGAASSVGGELKKIPVGDPSIWPYIGYFLCSADRVTDNVNPPSL
jgi:hypothetical protein